MITIKDADQNIVKLWEKPFISDDTYRLMRYVLRVDYKKHVLLYNVVTAQLVVLDELEVELLDSLPIRHSSVMNPLIEGHFLVRNEQDEHTQVVDIRNVLQKLSELRKPAGITSYTILPTTACNARCYYCFEQGMKTSTMSERTAEDVVEFITQHCGSGKNIFIKWFGGEPTLAANRIDQICKGLSERGIKISSSIITNGYLFDEDMITRAKNLWKLDHAQITVDGVGNTYNQIKNYVNPNHNPYQRVMRNIGLFIKYGIKVGLRMNFDVNTYLEFTDLLKDAVERYGHNPLLQVYAHPVIGEYTDHLGSTVHGDETWFRQKVWQLNRKAKDAAMLRNQKSLTGLKYKGCQACSSSAITITPEGGLVRCPEQYREDSYVGSIKAGIVNNELYNMWKEYADYSKCVDCVFFPQCVKLMLCGAGDKCGYYEEKKCVHRRVITELFDCFSSDYRML